VKKVIQKGLISAAHDVSDGGLFVTLVEMGLNRGLGFDITADADIRMDAFLFGESQSRVVVSMPPELEDEFIETMRETGVPFTLLGHVTRGKMVVDDRHFGFVDDAADLYLNALERIMESGVTHETNS
jgi:phosphoribosylformylglycinamidine synthase